MSPQTPAYRAVPTTPSSAFSTPSTLVDSTPRRYSDTDSPAKSRSLLASPFPRTLRLRPVHILLVILGFTVLGPILHPSSRSVAYSYLSSSSTHAPHIQPPTGGLDPKIVPMTLEARLSYLLQRPALDHNQADMPSRYNCPSFTYNRNYYFFHDGKPEQWERVNAGDVMRYRNRMVDHLRTVEREGGKLVWEKGMDSAVPKDQRRGLIFTAGDIVSGGGGVWGIKLCH